MRCRLAEIKNTYFVETGRKVIWEGPNGMRTPSPAEREFSVPGMFLAGGLPYLFTRQLLLIPTGKGVYRDGYGRKVFAYKERFPCFDSYDYKHEKRYYHWAYLTHWNRLICVYFEDGDRCAEVTVDVDEVPGEHFEAMVKAGLVDADGYLRL